MRIERDSLSQDSRLTNLCLIITMAGRLMFNSNDYDSRAAQLSQAAQHDSFRSLLQTPYQLYFDLILSLHLSQL